MWGRSVGEEVWGVKGGESYIKLLKFPIFKNAIYLLTGNNFLNIFILYLMYSSIQNNGHVKLIFVPNPPKLISCSFHKVPLKVRRNLILLKLQIIERLKVNP